MSDDQLVNLLTRSAIPILGLIAGFFYWAMNRSDARRKEERAEEEKEAAQNALMKQRYQALREQTGNIVNRSIRRFEAVRNRAEQGRNEEVARIADQAIEELERVQLPPLDH